MKIKMLTTAAGPEGVQIAGQVYDLPDVKAKAFIKAGAALAADPKPVRPRRGPVIETATNPPVGETTDAQ